MELVSVVAAKAVWFVDTRDINPHGLSLRHTLFPALVERYKFASYPKEIDSDPNKEPGDKFTSGEFRNAQGLDVMINFITFDDGIVAETRSSTRDCEAFLDELLEWAVKDFGLTFYPEMIRKKGHISELIVKSAYSPASLNPQLQRFADKLSSLVYFENGTLPFEPSGISFSPNTNTAIKPSAFIFERAADEPFSKNRYYSKAPIHTDIHLDMLNELEQIFRG